MIKNIAYVYHHVFCFIYYKSKDYMYLYLKLENDKSFSYQISDCRIHHYNS